jgi:hypothetical protein
MTVPAGRADSTAGGRAAGRPAGPRAGSTCRGQHMTWVLDTTWRCDADHDCGLQCEITPLIDRQDNLRKGRWASLAARRSVARPVLRILDCARRSSRSRGFPAPLAAARGCRTDKTYKDAGPAGFLLHGEPPRPPPQPSAGPAPRSTRASTRDTSHGYAGILHSPNALRDSYTRARRV